MANQPDIMTYIRFLLWADKSLGFRFVFTATKTKALSFLFFET